MTTKNELPKNKSSKFLSGFRFINQSLVWLILDTEPSLAYYVLERQNVRKPSRFGFRTFFLNDGAKKNLRFGKSLFSVKKYFTKIAFETNFAIFR